MRGAGAWGRRRSALRSARLPVNLIGSPISYANRLIGSSITSQSTAQAGAARGLKETNELLGKAGGQLFKARELNPNEQLPTLAYGQLALAKVRKLRV